MIVGKAVYARLLAVAAVTALVGTRIYASVAKQGAANPLIVYQVTGGERVSAMGSDTGLAKATVQVTSWADTYAGASALSEAVRGALQRWSGTAGSVTVLDVFLTGQSDGYDDETKSHAVYQKYEISFREP